MRDILEVINQITSVIPTSESKLLASLQSIVESIKMSSSRTETADWGKLALAICRDTSAAEIENWYEKVIAILAGVDSDRQEKEPGSNLHVGWAPFEAVRLVVEDAIEGRWSWHSNIRCKYIELRVDMRDGHCIIKDRNGSPLTIEELQSQKIEGEPS